MGKLKDLDAQGVTDLTSYLIGIVNERERFVDFLTAEAKRTGLGFIQYQTILEFIESSGEKFGGIEYNA
jgi:hypothetical protein